MLIGTVSWLALTGFGTVYMVSRFAPRGCPDCTESVFDSRLDPAAGTQVVPSALAAGLLKKNSKGSAEILGTFSGTCRSCSLDKLREDAAFASSSLPKIVLYRAIIDRPGAAEPAPPGFQATHAMPLSEFDRMNVRWYPRLATIDNQGRLKTLQRQGEKVEAFLARVER